MTASVSCEPLIANHCFGDVVTVVLGGGWGCVVTVAMGKHMDAIVVNDRKTGIDCIEVCAYV